jgi:hypothetical protein
MKNFILCLLLLLPSISNSQSIKDMYDLFQDKMRKSCQNTETNQVLIDDKNDFILIQNPEDENDFIRFKSFTKDDNTKIFGFQYVALRIDIDFRMTRTEFYVFKDNQWEDVTYDVYPNIGFKEYWGNKALPNQHSQSLNVDLMLPQEGTTVVAKSSPAIKFQFVYDILPNGYEEMIVKRKYKTIELNWNKTAGSFEIGKKY